MAEPWVGEVNEFGRSKQKPSPYYKAENACVAGSYPYKWSYGILLSTGRGPTFVGGGFSFNILFFKFSPRKLGK